MARVIRSIGATVRPLSAAVLVAVVVGACLGPSPASPVTSPATTTGASGSAGPSLPAPSATPSSGTSSGSSGTPVATPSGPVGGSSGPWTSPPSIPPLAWHRVTAAGPGPSARAGHRWVVDPSSAVAYLFGGRGTSGDLADLWAYDLTADAWQRLSPSGTAPRPRHDAAAAWIDGLGLVVIGGRDGDRALADAWVYDPQANAWRTLGTEGSVPSARSAACAAVAPDGRLWLIGGIGAEGDPLGDLWSYDPGPSRWARVSPAGPDPGPRSAAACWWTADGRLALHGGSGASGAPRGDTWACSPGAGADGCWRQIQTAPDPRADGATAVRGEATIIVGGVGAGGSKRSDAVAFDPRTLSMTRWAGPANGPSARSGAALVDDPEGERVVLFGGEGSSELFDDLWALDPPAG